MTSLGSVVSLALHGQSDAVEREGIHSVAHGLELELLLAHVLPGWP